MYKHVKRGTYYGIWGEGTAQISTELKDGDEVIIYKSVDDGKLYVRKKTEFFDGRFEEV